MDSPKSRILTFVLPYLTLGLLSQPVRGQPAPFKAALLVVHAHADDEGIFFGGSIPYYAVQQELPVVVICMSHPATGTRADELRCALKAYGLRTEPVFGGFGDCCRGEDLQCSWDCWGGKDRVVGFLVEQIRRYRPDVVLGHDPAGEYGHPNHMAAGCAVAEACTLSGKTNSYPSQLRAMDTWTPSKCYLHLYPGRRLTHSWDMACSRLNGRTPREVTNEGLRCHASQRPYNWCVDGCDGYYQQYSSEKWGLFSTSVGPDSIARDDFFEHVDLSWFRSRVRKTPGEAMPPSRTGHHHGSSPRLFTARGELVARKAPHGAWGRRAIVAVTSGGRAGILIPFASEVR